MWVIRQIHFLIIKIVEMGRTKGPRESGHIIGDRSQKRVGEEKLLTEEILKYEMG